MSNGKKKGTKQFYKIQFCKRISGQDKLLLILQTFVAV